MGTVVEGRGLERKSPGRRWNLPACCVVVGFAVIWCPGCGKPAPELPPADTSALPTLDPEQPAVAFHEPEEMVQSVEQQIKQEAAKSEKTPEDVRRERIEKEIVQEYTTLAPAAGDGAAYADPTGKICWRAFTCSHPKCGGQGKNGNPFVFAYRYEGVTVGPGGQPDWSQNAGKEPMTMLGICPACGRANTVEPYYPPDVAKQAREIDKQVTRIKAKITAAMRQGSQAPQEMFAELDAALKQREALPIYYLCE
jgi:hypothetical protein